MSETPHPFTKSHHQNAWASDPVEGLNEWGEVEWRSLVKCYHCGEEWWISPFVPDEEIEALT